MTPGHAAALALLDRITPGPWALWGEATPSQTVAAAGGPFVMQTVGGNDEANARAIAALPEFAALYRAVVKNWQLYEGREGKYDFASIEKSEAMVSAALAAVADKLAMEGK